MPPDDHGSGDVGAVGLETLHYARRSRPDLKVLFTKGYADLARFGGDLSNHPLLKKPMGNLTLAGGGPAVRDQAIGIFSGHLDDAVLSLPPAVSHSLYAAAALIPGTPA